jgi:phosphoribosylanthranilate isomerase
MSGSPRIKICGLRDAQTIAAMDGLPIHEIGFVFAPSKRQVEADAAGELIRAARSQKTAGGEPPRTVGVFVNEDEAGFARILAKAPLDIVQLHGEETPELCAAIRSKHSVLVWKVFSIKSDDEALSKDVVRARLAPFAGQVDALLIDAPGGGTGHPFNWEAISAYQQAAESLGLTLYVAGGLHADNVQQLIARYAPDGIDVSSGVETDGRKDIDKIRLFVERVIEA